MNDLQLLMLIAENATNYDKLVISAYNAIPCGKTLGQIKYADTLRYITLLASSIIPAEYSLYETEKAVRECADFCQVKPSAIVSNILVDIETTHNPAVQEPIISALSLSFRPD